MEVSNARKLKDLEAENSKLKRMVAEQLLVIKGLKEFAGKMISPTGRREAMACLIGRGVSKRASCRYLGFSGRVEGYELRQPKKDQELGARLMETTQQFPRFGYRRSAAWVGEGEDRAKSLWSLMGLGLPRKRPRRRRCGSDMRLLGAVKPMNPSVLRCRCSRRNAARWAGMK